MGVELERPELVGFAVESGIKGIDGVSLSQPEQPVAVLRGRDGQNFFASEPYLAIAIDALQTVGDKRNATFYGKILEELHDVVASGVDLGPPLTSAREFANKDTSPNKAKEMEKEISQAPLAAAQPQAMKP